MGENEAAQMRADFAAAVRACQRCEAEAVRPWRVACTVLAAVIAALVCMKRS